MNEEMNLNDYGEIFQHNWLDLPQHYPDVQLDAFVIMPNHVHGLEAIAKPHSAQKCHSERTIMT
ncbi:MAG: hypothetical protein WBW55_09405 [Desulfobaccales bacterium]